MMYCLHVCVCVGKGGPPYDLAVGPLWIVKVATVIEQSLG